MYILVFGRDDYLARRKVFASCTVLKFSDSLEKLTQARDVCGDLIFNEKTGEIVKDSSWLFEWEKGEPNCYAQRCIRENMTLPDRQKISYSKNLEYIQ